VFSCFKRYRPVIWPVSLFFILLAYSVTADEFVVVDPTYRDELIASALDKKLYDDPYWRLLGHYRPRWFGGYKSMIDDPAFFNASNGKYSPRDELVSTISAFFDPAPDDPEVFHPMCRFPARFAWLQKQLGIDELQLPVPTCESFDRVFAYMKPQSATLVFPAAFMNSPASMFGHTLIVFDAKDKNRLLSKGVGYAAAVTTGFGPLFAIEGILGMYPGSYSVESYYDKVEQYNDIHQRDIWEYELDFTTEEVELMFRHAWELQNIWSWYYFFDENCAYKMYQLIDAARPDLNLSDDKSWFVIPIDTVKLIASRDIVRTVTFRPSKATRMTAMADQLPAEIRKQSIQTGKGRQEPAIIATNETYSLAERRLALDLSADYTQYLLTEKIIDHDAYTKRYLSILRERSKLGQREENEFTIMEPSRPESGHSASMLGPGGGVENGDRFVSLSGRIAYHGLLDNDVGFTRGAQILFLNTEARWKPEDDDDNIELRFVDVVHVESISPRNDLYSPMSWRARLGFTQMDRRDDQNGMVFNAQTGGGGAWEFGASHLLFSMMETEIHLSDRYDSFVAGGPGASTGWMYTPTPALKLLTKARCAWIYGLDEDWWRFEAGTGLDIRLRREQSLRLYYQYTINDTYDISEANAAWNIYF